MLNLVQHLWILKRVQDDVASVLRLRGCVWFTRRARGRRKGRKGGCKVCNLGGLCDFFAGRALYLKKLCAYVFMGLWGNKALEILGCSGYSLFIHIFL